MFLTKEEFDRRINSKKNLANSSVLTGNKPVIQPSIDIHKLPLPDLSDQTTELQKNLVASLHGQGEKIVDISRALNIPIQDTKQAANTHKNNPVVRNTLERVRELALDKTMQALGLMTQEKFENASLKDLSTVASNCSKIIEKTTPQVIDQRVQFIIHKPETRSLGSYKVLDV